MNDLNDLLSKQALILWLLKEKLQVVNYLIEELSSNTTPFLFQNHFFINTTHLYFRSAIIDLGALVIARENAHKNNMHLLYSNPILAIQLSQPIANQIQNILDAEKGDIKIIHTLRDTSMAHYDLPDQSLAFETDQLPVVNHLCDICTQILEIAGRQQNTEFVFPPENLESLQRLVKDTEHLRKGQRQFPDIANQRRT